MEIHKIAATFFLLLAISAGYAIGQKGDQLQDGLDIDDPYVKRATETYRATKNQHLQSIAQAENDYLHALKQSIRRARSQGNADLAQRIEKLQKTFADDEVDQSREIAAGLGAANKGKCVGVTTAVGSKGTVYVYRVFEDGTVEKRTDLIDTIGIVKAHEWKKLGN